MKSPMVENADYLTKKSGYSELKILKSAAGYYIGTIFTDPDNGFQEPGSRDSDYFRTKEEAEAYLKAIEGSGEGVAEIVLRNHP